MTIDFCSYEHVSFLFTESGSIANVEDLDKGPVQTEQLLNTDWKTRLYTEVGEMYFFHGTKSENIVGVFKLGLDSKMGNGKAVYGQAIYMAESATKADQYTGKVELLHDKTWRIRVIYEQTQMVSRL